MIMANDLDPSILELWSIEIQKVLEKKDVFRMIASFKEEKRLKSGDKVHRPYHTDPRRQNYTRNNTFTVKDVSTIDESLTVDQTPMTPFYIDQLDEIQNSYPLRKKLGNRGATLMSNAIDAKVLGEYQNAADTVDDGDLAGGTSGIGLTLTTGNIDTVFAIANRKLNEANVDLDNRFAVISPQLFQTLWERIAGKESLLGDKTGLNGNVGRYAGFNLMMSNNLSGSGTLVPQAQFDEGDTVTLQGVTFTFNASPSGAGSVDIGSDLAGSIDNLVAAINDSGTVDTTYVQLTQANRDAMFGITAARSGNTMTIVALGNSFLTVSAGDSNDVWTANIQLQHQLFGRRGSIDVVVQKFPNITIKQVPDKLGVNVVPWTLYGVKTFNVGTSEILDVQTRSDAY